MIELRFRVLKAANVKTVVFWVIAPCSLVKFADSSEVLAASIVIAVMMESENISEMSADFYQTTPRRRAQPSSHY
jgi:hypothetical protein